MRGGFCGREALPSALGTASKNIGLSAASYAPDSKRMEKRRDTAPKEMIVSASSASRQPFAIHKHACYSINGGPPSSVSGDSMLEYENVAGRVIHSLHIYDGGSNRMISPA